MLSKKEAIEENIVHYKESSGSTNTNLSNDKTCFRFMGQS